MPFFLNGDGTRWHGVVPHGVGYGVDDASAIIGHHRGARRGRAFGGSDLDDAAAHGELCRSACRVRRAGRSPTPVSLILPAGSTVDADSALEWVPAHRWPQGETVWVPIDIAACSVGDLSPGYVPFTTPITNGLGAGPTLDFAIGHGIGELLQRDGNGTGFRAMDRGIALTFGPDEPRDPRTRALLAELDRLGIEVIPKFATDEFGTANVYCVGAERPGIAAAYPIMVTAAGEASSLDREHALAQGAVRVRRGPVCAKVFSHARLADIAGVAPADYLERFRAHHTLGGEESRSLTAMVDWLRLDQPSMRNLLADTVLSRQATKPFSELPTWDGPLAGTGQVEEFARRFALHGMEILYVDFSPPGHPGVRVVKAIVPGLEVETMSYHRIGARGVRKLLDRGSKLVGLGAPPAGAQPVRMTAAGQEWLGGPAWLDTAEVDRIVGRLYPLYREPEVHSAPIWMEAA